jgi:hypothetical protein
LPALALAIGRFLDQMLSDRDRGGETLLGLLLAAGAILLARDLGQAPTELVATHLASKPTWPVTLEVRGPLLVVGIAAAAACLLLVAVPRSVFMLPAAGRLPPLLIWLRRAAPVLLLGTAAGQALWLSHGLLPALGHHLSPKRLFATFEGLRPASTSATLGIYAGAAREAPWAARAKQLDSVSALADSLAAPGDHFALIPRAELGRIDRQLADRGLRYAVADDSSSRLLLLASRLPGSAGDRNPLNDLRWRPSLATTRPWKAPGRPVATFGGAIDLVGADFPARVSRPGGLPVTLFLQARATPPPDHQIFVHLERPGTLLNGDHPPLGGIFPTTLWTAGDHLRDRHLVPLPLVLAPPGTYRVLVGFWPGGNTDRRLPVSGGDHDGRHRVYLGTVEVR